MNDQLGKDLVEIIGRYLHADQSRTLMTLAKEAEVGYTTVRRIAQGECSPNQETALAVIGVALSFPEKVSFLRKHYPKTGKIVEDAAPNEQTPYSDPVVLRRFLSKEIHNLVFNLAATAIGTDDQQIQRVAGEKGIRALNELLDNEVLIRDHDGRVRYPQKVWTPINTRDLLQQMRHSVNYFDTSLLASDAARLLHITGSVNRPTLQKINQLSKETGKKILAIKSEKKSEGKIPFFVDMLMNVYDRDKFKNAG